MLISYTIVCSFEVFLENVDGYWPTVLIILDLLLHNILENDPFIAMISELTFCCSLMGLSSMIEASHSAV